MLIWLLLRNLTLPMFSSYIKVIVNLEQVTDPIGPFLPVHFYLNHWTCIFTICTKKTGTLCRLQHATQYQGTGSSHELGTLMVTEDIQQSKTQKLPLFLLFLDARSALDTVVTKFLVRYLYLTGVEGGKLLLLNNRLAMMNMVWSKVGSTLASFISFTTMSY